jgi:hypothetical protein
MRLTIVRAGHVACPKGHANQKRNSSQYLFPRRGGRYEAARTQLGAKDESALMGIAEHGSEGVLLV